VHREAHERPAAVVDGDPLQALAQGPPDPATALLGEHGDGHVRRRRVVQPRREEAAPDDPPVDPRGEQALPHVRDVGVVGDQLLREPDERVVAEVVRLCAVDDVGEGDEVVPARGAGGGRRADLLDGEGAVVGVVRHGRLPRRRARPSWAGTPPR
jgi:hypothetical protein